MSADYHTAQDDFGSIVSKLQPIVMSNFVMWLDMKVAEFKVYGHMLLKAGQEDVTEWFLNPKSHVERSNVNSKKRSCSISFNKENNVSTITAECSGSPETEVTLRSTPPKHPRLGHRDEQVVRHQLSSGSFINDVPKFHKHIEREEDSSFGKKVFQIGHTGQIGLSSQNIDMLNSPVSSRTRIVNNETEMTVTPQICIPQKHFDLIHTVASDESSDRLDKSFLDHRDTKAQSALIAEEISSLCIKSIPEPILNSSHIYNIVPQTLQAVNKANDTLSSVKPCPVANIEQAKINSSKFFSVLDNTLKTEPLDLFDNVEKFVSCQSEDFMQPQKMPHEATVLQSVNNKVRFPSCSKSLPKPIRNSSQLSSIVPQTDLVGNMPQTVNDKNGHPSLVVPCSETILDQDTSTASSFAAGLDFTLKIEPLDEFDYAEKLVSHEDEDFTQSHLEMGSLQPVDLKNTSPDLDVQLGMGDYKYIHSYTGRIGALNSQWKGQNCGQSKNLNFKMTATGKEYLCPYENCSYSTKWRTTLIRHKWRHESLTATCEMCGKVLRDPYQLRTHVRLVHLKKLSVG